MRAAMVVLLFVLSAKADQWEFFHPETVLAFSCTVRAVILQPYGDTHRRDIWEAEASAKRAGEPSWATTLGQFEHSVKGRHEAERVCSKWMDEAAKRVNRAH